MLEYAVIFYRAPSWNTRQCSIFLTLMIEFIFFFVKKHTPTHVGYIEVEFKRQTWTLSNIPFGIFLNSQIIESKLRTGRFGGEWFQSFWPPVLMHVSWSLPQATCVKDCCGRNTPEGGMDTSQSCPIFRSAWQVRHQGCQVLFLKIYFQVKMNSTSLLRLLMSAKARNLSFRSPQVSCFRRE